MKNRIVTEARRLGAGEAYAAEAALETSFDRTGGTGAAKDPYRMLVSVTNRGEETFTGVIRLTLPACAGEKRFFLPGFMYGTNRGEAPLTVDSKCPRMRYENAFPASPFWMTRSDRLSHPAAFAFAGGRMTGLCASPYLETEDGAIREHTPGARRAFYRYNGFGCSLDAGGVWFTLGWEHAPAFFLESHRYFPRAPLEEKNCVSLKSGETVHFTLWVFDFACDDERGLNDALEQVYSLFHEAPRVKGSPKRTVEEIAGAVARDAWLEEKHCYSGFVFDRGDHFEYNALPSFSWTNGLAASVPMLLSALRLENEPMRVQALKAIEHTVSTCLNPRNGLPFTCEENGVWSNRGWWYDKQPVPGHAAYLVGQGVYLLLKAYEAEKKLHGILHGDWLRFCRGVLEVTEKSRNGESEYPYIFSDRSGAGLDYDSFSGAWCLAAAAYFSFLTGEREWLPGLIESEKHYHSAYIAREECYGGPLDIDKNVDSEGVLAYLRAVRYLHGITGDNALLCHMRDALCYEYSFKFCYNSPVKVPPLSETGWSSCGGSITSVANPHIHPMSSSVCDEMLYYLSQKEDAYIRSRLRDTVLWSCQNHNTFDGEFGYGRTGWMSERFCHSEGLVKPTFPDGPAVSTWQALMPWACGSILEGLTGEVWDTERI